MAIEGNTGAGNDADGGQVQRRTRGNTVILGAFRPDYDIEEKEGEDVVAYKYLKDVPEKFRPVIDHLMTAGIIRGGGFDAKLRAAGLPPAVG